MSVVTWAEVFAGTGPEGIAETTRYLEAFPLLDLSVSVAVQAGQLRQSERWRLPDAFQAALARHHGIKLATRNTKDFHPDRQGFVVVPYTI